MKIWVVDQNANLMYYGYSLCLGLAHQGSEVTLVSRYGYQWQTKPHPRIHLRGVFSRFSVRLLEKFPFLGKIPLLRTLLKIIEYPFSYIAFFKLLRREEPDIIHFQYALIPLIDSFVFRRLKKKGIPFVFTVHNIVQPRKIKLNDSFLHWSYGFVDRFIVHSQANAVEFSRHYGLKNDRISVIPHGNYNAYITEANLTQGKARQRLDLPPNRPIILFFGIIFKFKGLEFLIQALEQASGDQAPLLLVAGKPATDFAPYQREIERLGLQDRVLQRLEFIPNEDLQWYFAACDVVALPYTRITQSGVLLTAYSFGKPTVATRVGSFPETVLEGKTGFLADPGDVSSLAQALDKALSDPERLAEMSRFTKEHSDREYDWDRIGEKTRALYQEALSAANRGSN